MKEVLFALPGIALTVLCWGSYGTVLHKGQHALDGDRLKPLICVGAAYFIVAIIVPMIILGSQGKLASGWHFSGITWSMVAGTAGALGALGIILALTSGGKPIYVMPLVFGGAPIINVFVSMYFENISLKELGTRGAFFLAGVIMVAVGAAMVLIFAPKGNPQSKAPPAAVESKAEPAAEPEPKKSDEDAPSESSDEG